MAQYKPAAECGKGCRVLNLPRPAGLPGHLALTLSRGGGYTGGPNQAGALALLGKNACNAFRGHK